MEKWAQKDHPDIVRALKNTMENLAVPYEKTGKHVGHKIVKARSGKSINDRQ
jgi:hypothetical protein